MAAFIKFANLSLSIWDNMWEQKNPWFNIIEVRKENIILNILGLSTKFEDPIKCDTPFKFREIFIGEGHHQSYNLLKEPSKDNNGFVYKSFNDLKKLLNEFEEKFPSDFKYDINHTAYLNIINNVHKENVDDEMSIYSNIPILTLHRWALPISYAPSIGSSELKNITLWFNSESEALQFRDQLMLEVEDFYKMYASFVKEIILKKD